MNDAEAGLYVLDPDTFTNARDALARQRKADGDLVGAAAVTRLRRPTVAAWLLNLTALQRPALVSEVVDLAARLRSTQSDAVAGRGGGGLRALTVERRDVVRRTVQVATEIGQNRGRTVSTSHIDEMTRTVEAALADEELAGRWSAGQLAAAAQAAGFAFADVDAAVVVTKAPARSGRSVVDPSRPAARTSISLPDGRSAVLLEARQQELMSARTAVAAAHAEVERVREISASADRAARAARQALKEACRVAARAELMAATAEQAVWELGDRSRRE